MTLVADAEGSAHMMKVSITFFGWQRKVTHVESVDMPINEATTVADALEYVRQQFPDLPLEPRTVVAMVNQQLASPDRELKSDDIVSFMPYIGGG